MFFAIITLVTALAMAITAATFAIFGIMAVFAGAPIAALIMGTVIELGKIVGVSWIYQNWKEKTSIKITMLPAVIVAMLLTSMGIFGFLSKAHLDQNAPAGNNTAQIERLDQRIAREQSKIDDAETVKDQLDEQVSKLIQFDKVSGPNGSRAVRAGQEEQRNALAVIIDESEESIGKYQDERLILSSELRELELDVGPVKYIAALLYEDSTTNLEKAVRVVIIAFIFVFDPMAILLLMGANYSFMQLRGKEPTPTGGVSTEEPDDETPGKDLINLIDDETDSEGVTSFAAEKTTVPVDTIPVKLENELDIQPLSAPEPDRAWIREVPKHDKDIDSNSLIKFVQRLKARDRTADENQLWERFRKLAASRNIPWDIAQRASVSTRNDLLKN